MGPRQCDEFRGPHDPPMPAEHWIKLRAASILAAPLVSFNPLFGRALLSGVMVIPISVPSLGSSAKVADNSPRSLVDGAK